MQVLKFQNLLQRPELCMKMLQNSGTGYSFSGALIDLRSGDLNLNPEQFHGLYDVESI